MALVHLPVAWILFVTFGVALIMLRYCEEGVSVVTY